MLDEFEIARVQEQVQVRLLRGTESDILEDGALDIISTSANDMRAVPPRDLSPGGRANARK